MDFKSLHCFAELVRLQSFSAAASALNLTHDLLKRADENGRQQQLSEREFERRIKTLEDFCDQALSESKAA